MTRTVFVVSTEWNRGSDLEGASTIEGVYTNAVAARRAKWAAMREYIAFGHDVYGRRNDDDWTCDVTVQEMTLQTEAPRRAPASPACRDCHARTRCYCRGGKRPAA